MIHAIPFVTEKALLPDSSEVVVLILVLETTGVDVSQDRIVELAATHACGSFATLGASFSTVVSVPEPVLCSRGSAAAAVHAAHVGW